MGEEDRILRPSDRLLQIRAFRPWLVPSVEHRDSWGFDIEIQQTSFQV